MIAIPPDPAYLGELRVMCAHVDPESDQDPSEKMSKSPRSGSSVISVSGNQDSSAALMVRDEYRVGAVMTSICLRNPVESAERADVNILRGW